MLKYRDSNEEVDFGMEYFHLVLSKTKLMEGLMLCGSIISPYQYSWSIVVLNIGFMMFHTTNNSYIVERGILEYSRV